MTRPPEVPRPIDVPELEDVDEMAERFGIFDRFEHEIEDPLIPCLYDDGID